MPESVKHPPRLIKMSWGGWLDPSLVGRVDWHHDYVLHKEDDEGKLKKITLPFAVAVYDLQGKTLFYFSCSTAQKAKNKVNDIARTLNGQIVYPRVKGK